MTMRNEHLKNWDQVTYKNIEILWNTKRIKHRTMPYWIETKWRFATYGHIWFHHLRFLLACSPWIRFRLVLVQELHLFNEIKHEYFLKKKKTGTKKRGNKCLPRARRAWFNSASNIKPFSFLSYNLRHSRKSS